MVDLVQKLVQSPGFKSTEGDVRRYGKTAGPSGMGYDFDKLRQAAIESQNARSSAAAEAVATADSLPMSTSDQMRTQANAEVQGAMDLARGLDRKVAVTRDRPLYEENRELIDAKYALEQPGVSATPVYETTTNRRQVPVTETVTDPITGEVSERPVTTTETVVGPDGTPSFVEKPVMREVTTVDPFGGDVVGLDVKETDAPVVAAQKKQMAADKETAQTVAQHRQLATDLATAELAARQDAEKAEAMLMAAQEMRMRQGHEAVDEANKAYAKAPPLEYGRTWKNMGTGRKILAVLGMIGDGVAGTNHTMTAIQTAIDQDVKEQEEAYERIGQGVVTAKEKLAAEYDAYGRMRARGLDKAEAAEGMRLARWNQAETALQAALAARGVQQLTADQEAAFVEIRKQQAESKFRLDAARKANTPTVTTYVHAAGPTERKIGGQIAAQGVKNAGALTTGAFAADTDLEKARITAGGREAAARATAEGKIQAAREGRKGEQKQFIANKTVPLRESKRQMEGWKSDYANEIPGFVAGVGWIPRAAMTDEMTTAYDRTHRLIMRRLREESGAAIGADEKMADASIELAIQEKADAFMGSLQDEDDLRNAMDRRLEEIDSTIGLWERAVDDPALTEYTGSAPVEKAALTPSGVGGVDPVQWDDDEED